MSVKIAEFMNGKMICGEQEDNRWNNLFFIQNVTNNNGKSAINFMPVIQFGDFNQPITIEKEQIVYLYDPDQNFIQSYRTATMKYKIAQSGLILPGNN